MSFLLVVLGLSIQDPAVGVRSYEQGDFAAAAAAFRAAASAQPEVAELQYDLALSEWHAGNLVAAEEAAERYASLPGGSRVDLHRGLLGMVRYAEAEALAQRADAAAGAPTPLQPANPQGSAPAAAEDPLPLLEQAVQKATAARDEFLRAAAAPRADAALARNVERSLRLLADLQRKLEELKQQREQQQDDKQDGEKSDEKSDAKQQQDQQSQDQKNQDQKGDQDKQQQGEPKPPQDNQPQDQKNQDQQQGQQQQDKPDAKDGDKQPQQGAERPEPKPPADEPQQQPQQPQQQPNDATAEPGAKTDAARPEPKAEATPPAAATPEQSPPRTDAPGEQTKATMLSPEQTQRLLDELQKLDERLRRIRANARSARKPVERDW